MCPSVYIHTDNSPERIIWSGESCLRAGLQRADLPLEFLPAAGREAGQSSSSSSASDYSGAKDAAQDTDQHASTVLPDGVEQFPGPAAFVWGAPGLPR